MQFKWLRILLPKMERFSQESVACNTDVSMKCGTGRKQTARKAVGMKNLLDPAQQKAKQNPVMSERGTESSDHRKAYGKQITEMLMFCVKCKDVQKFSFAELKEHCQQKHPDDKPMFVCSKCGFTVDDVERMNVHAISHKVDSSLSTGPGNGKEGQSSRVEGKQHKTRHLKPDTLYCNKCRFSTKDPLQFQKHMLRHDEIQYKCGRCDHVCYTRGEFQRHSVQHTGTFPFKCRYCDYGAVRKDYVVKHTKGVHRDIVKNGGSVLVLPMRKGHKKAFPKPNNGLKGKQTTTSQNENSASMILNDQVTDSVNMAPNPQETSCQLQDLDIAVLPQADITVSGENKCSDKTVQYVKRSNYFSTDARRIRLQVLANSKHVVQPGTPLTLVTPAQVVIPSNCLAQLIEIKSVNGKQQLVFKLIPQASASACPVLGSDASGIAPFSSQEMEQDMNIKLANRQKSSMSNNSPTFLPKNVDHNLFPHFDHLKEDFDTDQNGMVMNTKAIYSTSHILDDKITSSSILEFRNKSNPKWKQKVITDQLQGGESVTTDSSWASQQNGFLSPNILGKAVHCVLDGKTVVPNLNLDTQEIITQVDNESLTFSGHKEMQKSKSPYLTNEVATGKGQESVSNCEQPFPSRFNNTCLEVISINKASEKPFVQLPKVVQVLPKPDVCLCDNQLMGSGCKTAISSVESLPVNGTEASTQLCIKSFSTSDTSTSTQMQVSSASSRNVTASSSQNHGLQVVSNFSPVQPRLVSKDTNHAEHLICQGTEIVYKQPINEAFKSGFEDQNMCCAVVQNFRNKSASCMLPPGSNEVCHIDSSLHTLKKYEKNRKMPDMQLSSLEHGETIANDINKSGHNNQILVTKPKTHKDLQKNINCPSSAGVPINMFTSQSTSSLAVMSKVYDDNELGKKGFLSINPDAHYSQDTLQGITVNADLSDFDSHHDLEGSKSTEDHLVDTQWPIISSVFSLSSSTDIPESIKWDNIQDSPLFASAQILKPDLCPLIQADCINPSNMFEERKKNKECQRSEQSHHKNLEHISRSEDVCLGTTAVRSVESQKQFKLSRDKSLCLSLLPPVSPIEIEDSSSAHRFEQFDDDFRMTQDAHRLDSGEFSLNQTSSNVCLGQSPTSCNNTIVEHSTCVNSFVQIKQLISTPSSTENSTTLTQNHQTKLVSSPKLNVWNLSPDGISIQSKSLPNIPLSDRFGKPSVSHNITSNFLLSPSPSGVTNVLEEQVQHQVGLVKVCEPNGSSSERVSFYQNICHFSEEVQTDVPITSAAMPSVKLCHQLSGDNKDSLFSSSTNSKNVNSADATENHEQLPHNLGQTPELAEKLTLSPTKLQNVSLSVLFPAGNQSNHKKVQLKLPGNSRTHSVLSPSINHGHCFPVPVDASAQTKCVNHLVNSQNTDEIRNNKPNMGQNVLSPIPQFQSMPEIPPLCTSAFPVHSTEPQIDPESAPPPHPQIKDTDCTRHEATYKVVSSGIVLRVLNAADESKQKASAARCKVVNQLQKLSEFSSLVSESTTRKSDMQAPLVTKKRKEPNSVSNYSPKAKQANRSCNMSSDLIDQPNVCNTTTIKLVAHQKSQQLKVSEELPLKRKCTRKGKTDQVQHLKNIEKKPNLVPIATDICELELLKTARKLRLKPFNDSQLVKCPRRNQPVVVLNHPDVDIQEVTNVMQTIGKYRGHVLKVVLSERTVISLNLKKKQQRQEIANQSILHDKWQNCKVVSPVKERLMLKMKLKKIHKNNYQIVNNTQNEHLQFKFHCWFCGRMFCDQEEWIAHGQRHLMEATRDWNDVTTIQETTGNGAEVLDVEGKSNQ
ncbi:uncharacterized protein LOC132404605 [Hypanus sabinus]|uniref:uncharacterized protein LOC132404605 n=1 Tax=Hypanus sabinus TaxID=79690 RepID=UPI0028C3E94A|nr:uncharacterized protein LOC132404605 [Hypanus sabinus]XP_059844863.1 uncharacterized protein LOC132404605 [Hypanus sabinus]XP_059844864.1 uncharacterized protein LOC132404605 [Hypanus sabinus]XP_059844865.1 uncharacterized protein LOC132404605 [Hypanus sabinus]XP_059844866.1 uncharacterized protein LOC132404605 [Hypanus sabinus]